MSLTSRSIMLPVIIRSAAVVPVLAPSRIYNPQHSQVRPFIGQILGAITAPFETIQQIKDTKKLIENMKEDFLDQYELSKVPRVNTFEPFPGFFPRPRETQMLKQVLATQPSFIVVFGGSSVGKTALLRQVLSNTNFTDDEMYRGKSKGLAAESALETGDNGTDTTLDRRFIVMHIDLRIAGFANLTGLAIRLASQFEQFFETIMNSPKEDGIFKSQEDCDADGSNFDRINAQYAAQYKDTFKGHMLGFKQLRKQFESRRQHALESNASLDSVVSIGDIALIMERFQSSLLAYWQFEINHAEADAALEKQAIEKKKKKSKNSIRLHRPFEELIDFDAMRQQDMLEKHFQRLQRRLKQRTSPGMNPKKRIPVIILDEAHRLPALINSEDCVKGLLDAFLVLTKQDRLCHVVHTTSDPFYLHWLRALNIAQHTKIFTIQDCTYDEASDFFHNYLLPNTIEKLPSPGKIKQRLPKFYDIWNVFGGRLAHISDYIAEFIFSDGTLSPQQSSHFNQAYNNIKLHLTHDSFITHSSIPDSVSQNSSFDCNIFAQIANDLLTSLDTSDKCSSNDMLPLLPKYSLNYFDVCDKYGSDKVNSIVASGIFDISWTPPATTAIDEASMTSDTLLPPPSPACNLTEITPPKLHAMSRVYEKAMESIFLNKK